METYHGHVRSPQDAIILFEACRLGLLPRVQRRLSEKERQGIKSGSVFVWDEREAGMRRWTDGKSWSASRVSGSFLTYREMEGKRGSSNAYSAPSRIGRQGRTPNGDSDSDGMDAEGPDGYRYKPDGLMKQSFSITTANHQKLHLISYYARSHPNSQNLKQPTQDPSLKHIRPAKGMYPESTVHEQQNIPVTTRAPLIPSLPPGQQWSSRPYGHPQMIAQMPGGPAPPGYAQQPWPPTPMATPPGMVVQYPMYSMPGHSQTMPAPHPGNNNGSPYSNPSYQLPPAIQSQYYEHRQSLPAPNGHPDGSAPNSHRGSPLLMQRSPIQNNAQLRRTTPPLPPPNGHHSNSPGRYTPPGSIHSRTPPTQPGDYVDIPPVRDPPIMNGGGLPGVDAITNGKKVPACDISEMFVSNRVAQKEDARALNVLNRSFAA